MFNKDDVVRVADYPAKELVGREGKVLEVTRQFVYVQLYGNNNGMLFRPQELDKLEE